MVAFLQGLWAQYGAGIVGGIVVAVLYFVVKYVFPFMREAAHAWLTKRDKPWLIPLVDGAFDMAEAAITVSGLGNAKRALALGDLAQKLGHLPKGRELEVIDKRLDENAEADRKPLGSMSLQLNPSNSSTTLTGKPFGPQP
jgi:hypothetical protein